MKSILFVIPDMKAGGGQKSLLSLLNSFPTDKYRVDLMVIKKEGIFLSQIPKEITLVEAPKELISFYSSVTEKIFWSNFNIKCFCLKMLSIIGFRFHLLGNKRRGCQQQLLYRFWNKFIPNEKKHYDVAVSYIDDTNYYVIDHIIADKKILWCHNDYNKLPYVASFDNSYYEKADKICTISDICKNVLIDNFPKEKEKITVVENISSSRLIKQQADILPHSVKSSEEFFNDKTFKIISIGRLSEQKGFDYAIDSAKLLKQNNIDFHWYIIGEGPLREKLENQINENGLDGIVKLIGLRANPYPYIKDADIFVMTSRYEGKSIALDEAKILCKPIVVTKYPTVFDSITDGVNGKLVDLTPQDIADGIKILYENTSLSNLFVENLSKEQCGNEMYVINIFLTLIEQ